MSANPNKKHRALEVIGRLESKPGKGQFPDKAKKAFYLQQLNEIDEVSPDYIKKLQDLHFGSLDDHFKQKKYWSEFLMVVMWALVMYQCILLALVGAKIWDFTGYPWLLPVLLGQNFAQIVGLAVFVVKDLFRDKPIELSQG